MNEHGITKENLMGVLPPALRVDPSAVALAEALATMLADRLPEIDRLQIYPAIDTLDEQLLDILAYDFKVDWWDADYSLEEKQRTLKTSWKVHKTLGTKAAVETAASAIYPETRVQEWFEYGGEPYRFRLDVDLPEDEWTPERHKRLMWRLQYYKNLRSHLDSVVYRMKPVVLENRQAFWFAAMYITMRAHAQQRMALEILRLTIHIHQPQNNALLLKINGTVSMAFAGVLAQLLMRMRVSNFGQGVIYLDGRRLLDGSWLLNQGMIRGPALVMVRVTSAIKNRLAANVAATESNLWILDGKYRLNGGKKLNAGIRRSEL